VLTWLFVVWLISRFHGGEFDAQAATGLPSLIVLLLVMSWFFHKVYWTGWISSHHKRRRAHALHQRLPYRRLLIMTGVMLLFVLLVSVGEEVNEMLLAGSIGTTQVPGLSVPGWMGTWFSVFPNWETFAGQFIALAIVIGSYVGAQYLRVWRPRRRGRHTAHIAVAPPEERSGDRAARGAPANALA